ncbi:MAG: cell wall-active antibiotics response protein [Chloroflexi bacterium]|nr:cell wall-active antibiotics response protein [Chloroflexota bacterium]
MNSGRVFWAVVLIALGVVLLAGNLNLFRFRWDMLWAVTLILVGIWFVWRAFVPAQHHDVNFFAGIGELRPNLGGKEIRREEFSHGIGECDLDLTRATIPDGESTVKASLGIGELKIRVPRDLALRAQVNAGMGEAQVGDQKDDGIGPQIHFQSDDYATAARKLFIEANVGLGKVEIKRRA